MAIYTEAELIALIKEVDLAISAAVMNKSYELDTGQGRQKVTRQDLKQLREQREYWLAELETLQGTGLMTIDSCGYKHGHY